MEKDVSGAPRRCLKTCRKSVRVWSAIPSDIEEGSLNFFEESDQSGIGTDIDQASVDNNFIIVHVSSKFW